MPSSVPEDKKLTGAITVKFKTEEAKNFCFEKYGLTDLYPFPLTWANWMYWIRLPEGTQVEEVVAQLSQETDVLWAEAEWYEEIGPRS